MAQTLFYPAFILVCSIIIIASIPKELYREYIIYGILVGGLGDILAVATYQNLLHVMWFKNHGYFNVLGQIAWSPIAWTLAVTIFLYYLPQRRLFMYIYVATWACASVAYGYVVRNVGLFDFKPWFYPIPSYLVFLAWWTFATWLFRRTSSLVVSD